MEGGSVVSCCWRKEKKFVKALCFCALEKACYR